MAIITYLTPMGYKIIYYYNGERINLYHHYLSVWGV